MSLKLWLPYRPQFTSANGIPLSGAKLYFYAAGSVSTKVDTFTDDSGATPNANPLTLDASGRVPQDVWLTAGVTYKVGLAAAGQSDPPSVFIFSTDDVAGINDTTFVVSEWIAGPTPTYLSATSFSLVGDQTSTFSVGRRVKIVDSGGTKYATITASAFAALTTVTVSTDVGTLASPLSSVFYGVTDSANPSLSPDLVNRKGNAVVSAATTNIWATNGNEVHVTGSTGITSFGTAGYAGNRRTVIFDSTPTITHNATTLQIPGGQSVVAAAGDRWEVVADTTANMIVLSITKATGAPVSLLPSNYISGFTLTTASTTTYDIAAGQATDSTNAVNINGGAITAKSRSAWAVGSAAGGKLSAAALANATWYYWFAILKDSDGTVDYGFDVATTPTLPSGYTKYRYLGARKTASGATTWDTFIQHGDEVLWSTPPALDVNGSALSTANRTLTTINVPAVKVKWLGNGSQINNGGTTASALICTDPATADVAPLVNGSPLASLGYSTAAVGAVVIRVVAQLSCWTNTASQIGLRGITADIVYIQTLGWIDPRGKPV